jgi:acyl-CoA reductase-like NAD-dependent aldehyde dehydrogenase
MSTERILVHQDIRDEFTKILRETASVFDAREGFELCRDGAVDNIKGLIREAVDSVSVLNLDGD